MADVTWEQAVEWLRHQPAEKDLVRACYFDDPLIDAARRYAARDEFHALEKWLPPVRGRALDVGAGRGITAFALARTGWRVTAAEPDDSPLVGTGAIAKLAGESGLPIDIVRNNGESLPFGDGTFSLVHGRQVLHHAGDLVEFCREIGRVLKPAGRMVATREHVISNSADLPVFLADHPLHELYGGETAYPLREYTAAIEGAGLRLVRVLGPFDSVINYFPTPPSDWREKCQRPLARIVGQRAARLVANDRHAPGRWLLRNLAAHLSRTCQTPGRLYTFVAEKTS